MLGNSRQHLGTNFILIMKSKNKIWPFGFAQYFMRSAR